ncbi:MAG TPA: MXAN_2562 family outer membrane beta-barrel protein, partial [Polyangia bacterium]
NGGNCDSAALCTAPGTQMNLQFWVQTLTANGFKPDFDPGPTAAVSLVGNVQVTPSNLVVTGGNEALNVTWDWGDINIATDTALVGVQLFCQRGADTPVFPTGTFAPAYQTPSILCPDNKTAVAAATNTGGPFANLDPMYLCSGIIPANSKSHRITGLQNGIEYGVGVAAVDRYYNIGAITNIVYEQPIPTVDFYTYYKDDAHGAAQGGYCALSGQHARPGAAALLVLAGLALGVRLRRRSKRRPPGAGTLVLLVAAGTLSAGPAQAQPLYHDSSFVQDSASEAWEGSAREFAIEARFGLYTPNVDSAFSGKGPKPQADIFGSKRRPMWQLEFDWEFLKEFGTLALGGVIGYYKENAEACTLAGLKQDPPICERSGDNTSLRLIPLAALLIYRLDEGASHWHIPLVPYAKIGLNYTIWTVSNGNGDVAWSGGSKGQGGTMGWQAAVGLSLQLDFIDPGASREFDADSGVNHTYAFFELAHIDASGLYRKDALRVGDNTWFAGLMFEF